MPSDCKSKKQIIPQLQADGNKGRLRGSNVWMGPEDE